MSFNVMSLIIKATNVGCVVHKPSTNFYKHSANKCKTFFLLSK